jgi:hypothetical protein
VVLGIPHHLRDAEQVEKPLAHSRKHLPDIDELTIKNLHASIRLGEANTMVSGEDKGKLPTYDRVQAIHTIARIFPRFPLRRNPARAQTREIYPCSSKNLRYEIYPSSVGLVYIG